MRVIAKPNEVAWFVKTIDVAVVIKGNHEGIDGTQLTGRQVHECFIPQSTWELSKLFLKPGHDSARNVIFDVTPEGYAAATEFEVRDLTHGI